VKTEEIKSDCRYFIGEKPCRAKRLCPGCAEYSPMGFRILIIKIGAMGDVLRTTPLLKALKQKYRESHITWLVDSASTDLLNRNPDIDRVAPYDWSSLLKLQVEHFDLLLSLEKIEPAIALAELIHAKKKLGFGMNSHGTLRVFNPEAGYALRLGIDDQLKFIENKKSYPHIIFEAVQLPFQGEEYALALDPLETARAKDLLSTLGARPDKLTIGVSPGAGHVFANKAWTIPGYVELIQRVLKNFDAQVLLLGGEREMEMNRAIKEALGDGILEVGAQPLSRFMAVVDHCDILISGDTLPMHIAIAMKKEVLAIFGPTCNQEIDLYGRGEKIVTSKDCAPCYRSRCDIRDHCMEAIPVDTVYEAMERLIKKKQSKKGGCY